MRGFPNRKKMVKIAGGRRSRPVNRVTMQGGPRMAWFRVKLTAEEQLVVNEERESHPHLVMRRRMLVLWLLHCGLTRVEAAQVAVMGRATVERVVEAFRKGGLEGLRKWNRKGPTSELVSYRDRIRESF